MYISYVLILFLKVCSPLSKLSNVGKDLLIKDMTRYYFNWLCLVVIFLLRRNLEAADVPKFLVVLVVI